MTQDEEPFYGWTIYHRPSDFPDHFVVRMWMVGEEPRVVMRRIGCICNSLEEAREQIPVGAICFARELLDDPVIIETWM